MILGGGCCQLSGFEGRSPPRPVRQGDGFELSIGPLNSPTQRVLEFVCIEEPANTFWYI
jgi:hypothetical protein